MSEDKKVLDRNLALDAVRATESAALAASRFMGRGDEMAADMAAIEAMRSALNKMYMDGVIVVGEGEPNDAPMLFDGEKVGLGKGPHIDIALDALEGTTITAKGGNHAVAVMAMTDQGGFLKVPDIHMEKIAVGANLPPGVVDLDASPEENLRNLALAKNADVEDLLVCILDRPRHEELIERVRETGARIMLISDGDVSGVIASVQPLSGVDIYMGSGGAPEGVLAAAGLYCAGGQMQGRLMVRSETERAKCRAAGIADFSHKYSLEEMVRGDVMFAATGVTDGAMLLGVRRFHGGAVTHSLVMRGSSGTVRYIESHHRLPIAEKS
jgi:fructose-1,6-bisphosphatase II / sedoheptulose-1,7-bisphosphatase